MERNGWELESDTASADERFEEVTMEGDFRQRVRRFCERVVAPFSADWDGHQTYPWELARCFAEEGWLALRMPRAFGGQDAGYVQLCIVMEEVARINPNLCPQEMMIWGPELLNQFGSEALRKKYYPRLAAGQCLMAQGLTEPEAGSALSDLKTTAVVQGDRIVINGRKWFTSLGQFATDVVVFARFGGQSEGPYGIGAVIVPTATDGCRVVQELQTMQRSGGAVDAEMEFVDCAVELEQVVAMGDPKSKLMFGRLMALYDSQRIAAAARGVGLAQGSLEEAINYTRTRKQFGRRLCEFQGIQWKIAEMAVKTETARSVCYAACSKIDEGVGNIGAETAIAKAFCSVAAWEVANEGLQILASRGYMRDEGYTAEARVRHARMLTIAGGTREMLLNLIASSAYGEKFPQRLSRGAVADVGSGLV